MATYAAYRHVELDKVGCGKRSAMKPPGGDCHDIFGADFHGTPSHHRVLKPPGGGTSSLFSPSAEDKPKSTANGVSVPSGGEPNGLAGKNGNEPDSEPVSGPASETQVPTPSQSQSESPSEVQVAAQSEKGAVPDVEVISTQSSLLSAEIRNLSAQETKRLRESVQSRNCVTGEGCQTIDHFVIRVHRQRDGNPVTGEGYDTTETQPTPPTRTRIPPGGYSSGLW